MNLEAEWLHVIVVFALGLVLAYVVVFFPACFDLINIFTNSMMNTVEEPQIWKHYFTLV